MTNQSSCEMLWDACPFTLGDEPLPCRMEYSTSEVWIGYAEFRISLHNLVHGERWKQSALLWQGYVQELLQLCMKRYLPLCRLGL